MSEGERIERERSGTGPSAKAFYRRRFRPQQHKFFLVHDAWPQRSAPAPAILLPLTPSSRGAAQQSASKSRDCSCFVQGKGLPAISLYPRQEKERCLACLRISIPVYCPLFRVPSRNLLRSQSRSLSSWDLH